VKVVARIDPQETSSHPVSPFTARPVLPAPSDDAQGRFCDAFGGRAYRIDVFLGADFRPL